jgi:hypothetical protein
MVSLGLPPMFLGGYFGRYLRYSHALQMPISRAASVKPKYMDTYDITRLTPCLLLFENYNRQLD